MKKAIVFINGENPPDSVLTSVIKANSGLPVICADGGYAQALKAGLNPNVLIGDMDSIRELKQDIPETVEIVYRPSQYMNDLEKTLVYCKEKGFEHLVIFGITGGRTDHTLGNISILYRYHSIFGMDIFGEDCQLFLLDEKNPQQPLKCYPGQQVSLIPISYASGIHTEGLKYPLRDDCLQFGLREGSSNEAVQSDVTVSIRHGRLLVIKNY